MRRIPQALRDLDRVRQDSVLDPIVLPVLQLPVERLPVDPQPVRRGLDVAVRLLHHLRDVELLHLVEGEAGPRRGSARRGDGPRRAHLVGQVLRHDLRLRVEDDRPLDDVLQLAHVAGPRVLLQALHRLVGDAHDVLAGGRVEVADGVPAGRRDVLPAVAEGRRRDRHDVEPVVEVGAELPLPDELLQVLVLVDAHFAAHLDVRFPADLNLLRFAHQRELAASRHRIRRARREQCEKDKSQRDASLNHLRVRFCNGCAG